MAVFRVFYDASGVETQAGNLAVIGLAATEKKWASFERYWNDALSEYGLSHHHHKNYAHSRLEFADWKGDDERRARYLGRMVACLKRGINKGFVAAVSNSVLQRVNEQYVFGDGTGGGAYILAADLCRKYAERWVRKVHPGSEIHHLFEKGDLGQGDLPLVARMFGRHDGFAIVPKVGPRGRVRPFEGADLLAWEVRRALDDVEFRRGRRARGALRVIGRMLPLAGSVLKVERLLAICASRPDLYQSRLQASKSGGPSL